MSFWNTLTGKAQKTVALRTRDENTARLSAAQGVASQQLDQGRNSALGNLQSGYTTSVAATQDAAARARTALGTGYDAARTDLRTQFGAGPQGAEGAISPYEQSGRAAQGLYDTALGTGTNGPQGQADFQSQFYGTNSPLTAARDKYANQQLQQQMNAGGQSASGRANMAIARASQQRLNTDYQDYLTRLQGQGVRGQQAAGDIAGIRTGLGTGLSNADQGEAQQGSALEQNVGTQLSNRGYQYGTDQAQLNSANAAAQANLSYGTAQTTNNYNTDAGNAVSQSYGVLPSLLMQGAGLAIRGFTPSTSFNPATGNYSGSSQTPFGNMWNGISGAPSAVSNWWNGSGSGNPTPTQTNYLGAPTNALLSRQGSTSNNQYGAAR